MFGELLSSWDVGQPRQKASHVCVCSIRAPGIPALGVRLVADCPGFASGATKGAYYSWNHRQCSGDP